jgi:hypothetical protein
VRIWNKYQKNVQNKEAVFAASFLCALLLDSSCYRTSQFSKVFYTKVPEMLDRTLKKGYNTILHQYAQ